VTNAWHRPRWQRSALPRATVVPPGQKPGTLPPITSRQGLVCGIHRKLPVSRVGGLRTTSRDRDSRALAGALPVWADTLARLRSASFQPVPARVRRGSLESGSFADGLETTPGLQRGQPSSSRCRGTRAIGLRNLGAAPADKRRNLANRQKWGDKRSSHGSRTIVQLKTLAAVLAAACCFKRLFRPPRAASGFAE